jgi:topoisomerase IA-like protein
MMRLRNPQNNVQVVVTDDKAARLIAQGTYEAAPAAEQPPKDTAPQQTAKTKSTSGPTSIAAAIKAAAGPMWDHAV